MKLQKKQKVQDNLPGRIDPPGTHESKMKDVDKYPLKVDREDGTTYHRIMNVANGVWYMKYGRVNNDIEAFIIIDKRTGEVVGDYDCLVSYNGAWNSASDKIDSLA